MTAAFIPMLFAILVYVAFFLTQSFSFLGNIAEEARDSRMSFLANIQRADPAMRGIVLLDFDDRTFAMLRDPALVPPAQLAQALTNLDAARPAVVFVDIDLTWVTDTVELSRLARSIEILARNGTLVLLARERISSSDPSLKPRYRSTPLDPFVARNPRVSWVGVSVPVGEDGVVRELPLIEAGMLDGEFVVLPSLTLALYTYEKWGGAAAVEGLARRGFEDPRRNRLSQVDADRIAVTRIWYSLTWPGAGEERSRPSTSIDVRRLPAWPMLRRQDPQIDPSVFAGRFVFLGSTANGRDIHATPLGEMPGAYILANSARAWLERGPEPGGGFWFGLLIVLIASFASVLIAGAVLNRVSRSWRPVAETLLPPVLTAGLWLLYVVLGDIPGAAGLIVIQYIVLLLATAGHDFFGKGAWLRYVRKRSRAIKG